MINIIFFAAYEGFTNITHFGYSILVKDATMITGQRVAMLTDRRAAERIYNPPALAQFPMQEPPVQTYDSFQTFPLVFELVRSQSEPDQENAKWVENGTLEIIFVHSNHQRIDMDGKNVEDRRPLTWEVRN
jgi:hypothetical protein